jgi:hypothetical protein
MLVRVQIAGKSKFASRLIAGLTDRFDYVITRDRRLAKRPEPAATGAHPYAVHEGI